MTPDLLDLAYAVVTSPHWRWCEGMVDTDGNRYQWRHINRQVEACHEDSEGAARWHEPTASSLPDLEDPGTLGCLLALYEETRQVRTCPDAVYTSAAVYGLSHPRTVAVLVAALLAAPAKEER